jgi:hypothetical protein
LQGQDGAGVVDRRRAPGRRPKDRYEARVAPFARRKGPPLAGFFPGAVQPLNDDQLLALLRWHILPARNSAIDGQQRLLGCSRGPPLP